MKQLVHLYRRILSEGQTKPNRTGIDTLSVFGHQMRFALPLGFPLATRKHVPFRLVASELLWFLKGQQDRPGALADLHADNNHIWDEWAKPDGSFGPIYGVQWRRWCESREVRGGELCIDGFDQITWLINELRTNPESRRLLVTAWQPVEIANMALPPCHVLFQLNCRAGTATKWIVDLQLYQRSCDAFLGVPFNIASYALLLHLLCQCAGPDYAVGDFVWTGGDVHLYLNHVPQVREYLQRAEHLLPKLRITPALRDIDAVTLKDLTLYGYHHSGALAAEVAV